MNQTANTVQLGQANQASAFRLWVNDIWHQNCEEHLTYGEDPYTIKQYWERYKYWLKREYKHQRDKK
jgi:hypothetical protein